MPVAALAALLLAAALASPAMPDEDLTDAMLMQAYARGEVAAFTRLVERHERALWRFVRRRLGSRHEEAADDVLQDTWINVARAAARYTPDARFTTWLFTIARNRAIDHLRRHDEHLVSLDAETGDEAEAASLVDFIAADARDEPLARIESRRQAEAFVAAIDSLPEVQREAFLLQAEAGMSLDEIAQATGVGAETAKSRLRYARARLRELLAAWSPA